MCVCVCVRVQRAQWPPEAAEQAGNPRTRRRRSSERCGGRNCTYQGAGHALGSAVLKEWLGPRSGSRYGGGARGFAVESWKGTTEGKRTVQQPKHGKKKRKEGKKEREDKSPPRRMFRLRLGARSVASSRPIGGRREGADGEEAKDWGLGAEMEVGEEYSGRVEISESPRSTERGGKRAETAAAAAERLGRAEKMCVCECASVVRGV